MKVLSIHLTISNCLISNTYSSALLKKFTQNNFDGKVNNCFETIPSLLAKTFCCFKDKINQIEQHAWEHVVVSFWNTWSLIKSLGIESLVRNIKQIQHLKKSLANMRSTPQTLTKTYLTNISDQLDLLAKVIFINSIIQIFCCISYFTLVQLLYWWLQVKKQKTIF